MKTKRLKNAMLAALAAFALAPSVSFAASDILIEPIGPTVMGAITNAGGGGASGGTGVWQNWFANNPGITNFVVAYDAANPPPTGSAGSMYQVVEFNGINGGTISTFACVDGNFWGGTKVDMGQYEAIEMDFKYDTTSDMTPATARGFDFGVNAANNSSSVPINLRLIYNTGDEATNFDGAWHHLTTPIPANIANAGASEGPGFKIFQPSTVSGKFSYWIANLKLIARVAPIPPPTLVLDGATPGLKQFADTLADYNRQAIRTDTTPANPAKNVDWLNHPGASYSWTVSQFPSAGHANFQMAMTITPDPAEGINYSDPDWSSTNALWLQVQANADGTVRSSLRWKTNEPSQNQTYGGVGNLFSGSNSPTAIGTWTLSFPNNTTATLTRPGADPITVTLPPDMFAAAPNSYSNISVFLYSGMQNAANLGQSVTFTSYQIAGVDAPFNEDLTDGALNTPFLTLMSQNYGANPNPINQVFVTSSDSYWLHWGLPDPYFNLVQKTNLSDTYWLDYAPGSVLLNGSARWIKIPTANLPSPNAGFMVLQQRTNFTQLQVLLPGEVAAPNTPTGKTAATPSDISLTGGGLTDVTVRAVDSNWNLISTGTNTVNLASTGGSALVSQTVTMVAGVATYTGFNQFAFTNTGTFTLTATNIDVVMPSSTSAPVNIIP